MAMCLACLGHGCANGLTMGGAWSLLHVWSIILVADSDGEHLACTTLHASLLSALMQLNFPIIPEPCCHHQFLSAYILILVSAVNVGISVSFSAAAAADPWQNLTS